MKKIVWLIVLALTFPVFARAQSGKIVGSWLMVKAEKNGKVQEPYIVMEFKKNGGMEAMGTPVGSWKLGPKEGTLTLTSKMEKDFNGVVRIVKLTATDLLLSNGNVKLVYTKILPKAIKTENIKSGLIGEWSLTGTDYPCALLKFSPPDSFKLVQASASEIDQASGNWIFDLQGPSIVFIGFSHLLRGKVAVTTFKTDAFTLKLADRTLKARRLNPSKQKIERLRYKEEDFPDEQPDLSAQLPWRDFDEMVQTLQKVAMLRYSFGKLIKGFGSLCHTQFLLSKIQVDSEKPRIVFTNFVVSEGDTSQISQKVKGYLQESTNSFFPKDEPTEYRVLGIEKITVGAGTFDCTVVEGIDGFTKVKYWMIRDMPGVYARSIREELDPLGDLGYTISELETIRFHHEN